MAYREAQYFLWDSASFGGATQAALAKVDVWFFKRPSANCNASGILRPGATMFVVPALSTANTAIPDMSNILTAPRCRLEYDELIPTNDANTAAHFEFSPPINMTTDKGYFFVMHYDGDEDFQLYMDKKGDTLVGSSAKSPGHPQKDIGTYFTFISSVPGSISANTSSIANATQVTQGNNTSNTFVANTTYSVSNWNPVTDAELKFTVFAARYAFNGDRDLTKYINAVSVSPNNAITQPSNAVHNTASGAVVFTIPSRRYEYIAFDHNWSDWDGVDIGERVFQRYPYYPWGNPNPYRVSCVQDSDIIYAPDHNFFWSNEFLLGGLEPEYIIAWSHDHDGPGLDRTHVRRVIEIINSYAIRVDQPCSWTNLSCWWHHSPVATIQNINETLVEGRREQMLTLVDTCANTTHRFTNHCFYSCNILTPGSGYSNTDWIVFTGHEYLDGYVVGGYPAICNLTTNSTGCITGLTFANLGCGFVDVNNIVFTVYRGANLTSNGTGFTCAPNIFAQYHSEFLGHKGNGGKFRYCRVTNLDLDECAWSFDMVHPAGTFWSALNRLIYYSIPNENCFFGRSFHCDYDEFADYIPVNDLHINRLGLLCTKKRCIPSWSNEFHICYPQIPGPAVACQAAGASPNSVQVVPPGTTNSSVLVINTVANGDYSSMVIAPSSTTVTYSAYIINDDYTNEHTNYGNALSKGIEKKVTFANDLFAEDIRVYLTAYKPTSCDVQLYVRIFNSHDSDAFDDKDWTRLELKDGNGVFSSDTDQTSMVELTYGFQRTPNVAITLAGTVTTLLNNVTITGVNTAFTSNIAVNDLVHFYQPLFPNSHQIAVVTAIANDTSITINDPVSNNDMVGSGLVIQKIGYPHQAFNNYLGDNVVRYYNSSMVPFDTFNSYQTKIVLLSNSETLVPRIDDIRIVGVSS